MSDTELVLCEVTGRQVPADETVILDGKRVCAEGKAVLLERMKSGESGESRLHPGFGLRFGAMLLDNLVMGVPAAIAGGAIGVLAVTSNPGGARSAEQQAHHIMILSQGVSLIAVLGGMTYFILMHGLKGQSLGKMACKLKVVARDDLSPITMRQSFLRSVVYQGPGLLTGLLAFAIVLMLPDINKNLPSLIGLPAGIYVLVSAIMAAADSDRQLAIHDRIAKTRVVRVAGLDNQPTTR